MRSPDGFAGAGVGFPDRPFHNFTASKSSKIRNFYVVQERLATDFEAPKLGKGWSG